MNQLIAFNKLETSNHYLHCQLCQLILSYGLHPSPLEDLNYHDYSIHSGGGRGRGRGRGRETSNFCSYFWGFRSILWPLWCLWSWRFQWQRGNKIQMALTWQPASTATWRRTFGCWEWCLSPGDTCHPIKPDDDDDDDEDGSIDNDENIWDINDKFMRTTTIIWIIIITTINTDMCNLLMNQ